MTKADSPSSMEKVCRGGMVTVPRACSTSPLSTASITERMSRSFSKSEPVRTNISVEVWLPNSKGLAVMKVDDFI